MEENQSESQSESQSRSTQRAQRTQSELLNISLRLLRLCGKAVDFGSTELQLNHLAILMQIISRRSHEAAAHFT